MESPIFATSNTCVRHLELKLGREVVLPYFGTKKLRETLKVGYCLRSTQSGERSKEMHVHIDGKKNEKILNYIKIKHLSVLKEPLQNFLVTLKQ